MNVTAIIIAAVINMVVGALWYSSFAFGKQWMKLSGISQEAMKKGAQKAYLMVFATALILSFVLSRFVSMAGAHTFNDGAIIGFWVWLGFVVTTNAADVIFVGKKMELFQLNMGYNLIALLLMGGALAAMMG